MASMSLLIPNEIYLIYDYHQIGRTALGFAVLNNHIDTVVLLLENGADVDVVDPVSQTAYLIFAYVCLA